MSLATRVQREQRYTRHQPCPICHGWQTGPKGQHCHAFYGSDGVTAFCSEIPGDTPMNDRGHYAHRLTDELVERAKTVATRNSSGRDKRNMHAVIPVSLRDGWYKTLEFPYHNADGSLLYVRVRYDPPAHRSTEQKRILPFQPVGDDWAMDEQGLEGRLPLEGWPDLLAAPATKTIFIAEGEKCTRALRKLGLVATTNPNGAGNWSLILGSGSQEALRGHPLVLLPDAGDKGRAHMEEVAASVAGIGASVRIVELPGLEGKEDVVDWLARGNTSHDLYDLVIATPTYTSKPLDTSSSTEPAAIRSITVERELRVMAEQTTARLRERDAWDAKLRANTNLRPVYKPTLQLLRDEWQRVARAPGQAMPIYREALAEKLGVPTNTVGAHLDKLAKAGIITKQPTHTYDENGLKRTHLAIVLPEETLTRPDGLAMLGWGGKRVQYCQNVECGSDDLMVRTTVICRSCGQVQHQTERPLNGANFDDNVMEVQQADTTAPAQKNCPAPQVGVLGIQKIQTGLFSESWEAPSVEVDSA